MWQILALVGYVTVITIAAVAAAAAAVVDVDCCLYLLLELCHDIRYRFIYGTRDQLGSHVT